MSRDLSDLRQDYAAGGLDETQVDKDPVVQFDRWFQDVINLGIELPNAMALATADPGGRPSARYVLLKEYDAEGFVFYSNSLSQKGRQMAENPLAALLFYWVQLHRQIRIEGRVEQLPPEKADAYFQSRPRGSQISAWIGTQSSEVPGRTYMQDRMKALAEQYKGKDVPRPASWIGYRLVAESFEFWQGQESRLHDRLVYRRDQSGEWIISRLAP